MGEDELHQETEKQSHSAVLTIDEFLAWMEKKGYHISENFALTLRGHLWLKDTRALRCLVGNQTIKWLGLEQEAAEQLSRALQELYPIEIKTLRSLQRKSSFFSSGSKKLDTILGGGFETGRMYEFVGAPASGKTQICYSAMLSCYSSKDNDGIPNSVLWIDTEESFFPQRLTTVHSQKKGKTHQLFWISVWGMNDFIRALLALLELCQGNSNLRLVIIDSLIEPFNRKFREDYQERAAALREIGSFLKSVSRVFNCVVITTNQIRPPISPQEKAQRQKLIPLGGYALAHITENRFLLEILEGRRRSIKVLDSSYLPPGETDFYIGKIGLSDFDSNYGSVAKPQRELKEEDKVVVFRKKHMKG